MLTNFKTVNGIFAKNNTSYLLIILKDMLKTVQVTMLKISYKFSKNTVKCTLAKLFLAQNFYFLIEVLQTFHSIQCSPNPNSRHAPESQLLQSVQKKSILLFRLIRVKWAKSCWCVRTNGFNGMPLCEPLCCLFAMNLTLDVIILSRPKRCSW